MRAPRGGKSAIGALIPDRLYVNSMEGKTAQQLLTANGPGFDQLREHWSGVTPSLLTELQDLHDRTGECLPSMFRDIVLAGGQRIARMFRLSTRMIQLWSAYRKLSGPRLPWRPAPVAPVVIENAVTGAWRNPANDGVSANHAGPTQPEPVTQLQPVAQIQPVTPTPPVAQIQPVAPTQPVAQAQPATQTQPVAQAQPVAQPQPITPPKSVIPPESVTKPAATAAEMHLTSTRNHSEATLEQLRLLEALFRPRNSGA